MKFFKNKSFWVLVAIVVGIFLGRYYPGIALYKLFENPLKTRIFGQEFELGNTLSEFLGKTFISMVKQLINPIIFTTITLGVISMGSLKKVGTLGAKALLYFEVVTTCALLIGIAVAWVLQPGYGVETTAIKTGNIQKISEKAVNFTWSQFFWDNSTLQVLLLAIMCGVVVSLLSFQERVIAFLTPISSKIFKALHYVMFLAPLGALGGMAFTIANYGIATILPLFKLMLCVYATMGIFVFVVLGAILKYCSISIWAFLGFIKQELLVVLGTSSSEAALPSLMQKLEKMGCSKQVVGLVVPAGYSFNLDGTTIYLSMAVLFLAQVFHVPLSLGQLGTIIGILMVTSKGAAGVTGSGFIVLASTLTAIKVIPLEGLALLLGVDRFMSEARSITNIIGNGVATVWLANHENELDTTKLEALQQQQL
jgi:aerobic C4-dicarboxylate transport protein